MNEVYCIEKNFDKRKDNNEHNYGIDLLRIIAMLYVVILHTLGQGGLLDVTSVGTKQYAFSWFIEIFAFCAVDIFALITGYVNYSDQKKKQNYSNYFVIWCQVVFYGVIVTLIFNFIHPEIVTKSDLFQVFFPITNNLYWYFTAYTGLIIIMPLLNAGIRVCSKETLKKLFIVLFVVFSIFDTVTNRFVFSKGYSFIWLVIIYLMGAIIKKCDIGKNIKVHYALIGIILCCIIGWYWKIYGNTFYIFDIKVNNNFLVSYTSPVVLLSAMLYLITFSKIKFNLLLKKIIAFAAPSAFAVYILNVQKFIWQYVMKNNFVYLANETLFTILMHIITFSLLFVIISIFIDYGRIKLFGILKIRNVANYFTELINKMLTWCANIL